MSEMDNNISINVEDNWKDIMTSSLNNISLSTGIDAQSIIADKIEVFYRNPIDDLREEIQYIKEELKLLKPYLDKARAIKEINEEFK